MNCQNPITIRNPSLEKFRREWYEDYGYPPSFDQEENYLKTMHMERTMQVPCGKCLYCFQNRQDEWRTRLQQEFKYSFTSYFVTLTYDPKFEPADMCVKKSDVQKFLKRLRARLMIPLRYFAISEYTPTGTLRPHYHFCMFFKDYISLDDLDLEVRKAWPFGFVTIGDLNDGRISYMSTYCIKFFNKSPEGRDPNFMLCSRRPFIGAAHLTDEMVDYYHSTLNSYLTVNHYKHKLPRIYRDKVFDDAEKVVLREKAQKVVEQNEQKRKERIKLYYGGDSLSEFYARQLIARLDYKAAYNRYRESKKF